RQQLRRESCRAQRARAIAAETGREIVAPEFLERRQWRAAVRQISKNGLSLIVLLQVAARLHRPEQRHRERRRRVGRSEKTRNGGAKGALQMQLDSKRQLALRVD